jgi:hypothetical protein
MDGSEIGHDGITTQVVKSLYVIFFHKVEIFSTNDANKLTASSPSRKAIFLSA